MVRYRTLLDAYKVKQHKYEKEVTGIDAITQLVQSTVATNGLPISDAVSVSTTEWKRKMPANVVRRLFSRCEAQANGISGLRNMTKPPAMQNPWWSLSVRHGFTRFRERGCPSSQELCSRLHGKWKI
ncbi:hypothetical protein E4U34_001610 [Claviceps purpurea]|nr:hypothetical protein E4U34_001610 [Claviceps purpurea]